MDRIFLKGISITIVTTVFMLSLPDSVSEDLMFFGLSICLILQGTDLVTTISRERLEQSR